LIVLGEKQKRQCASSQSQRSIQRHSPNTITFAGKLQKYEMDEHPVHAACLARDRQRLEQAVAATKKLDPQYIDSYSLVHELEAISVPCSLCLAPYALLCERRLSDSFECRCRYSSESRDGSSLFMDDNDCESFLCTEMA
jgi:hypothetical protein